MRRNLNLVWVLLLLLGLLLQPAAALAVAPAQQPEPTTDPAATLAADSEPAYAADTTGAEPFSIAADDAVNSVVGNGTPASCDGNAFEAAVTAGGTVTFNCGGAPHTIIVNTNVVANAVEIDGGNLITLDGENLRQIFLVQAGGSLKLRYITLTRGNFANGGAIDNAGTVELKRVNLVANLSEGVFPSGQGGAIYNRGGALLIEESTLEQSASGSNGGAIFSEGGSMRVLRSLFLRNYAGSNGGAISLVAGTLEVENSTFSINSASGSGGALDARIPPGEGSVTVKNATFYLNSASSGGTINTYRDQPTQAVNLSNSALYVSVGNQFVCSLNGTDDIASGGYNWANDDSCGLSGPNDVQQNVDPLLGELANNSGPTRTHLPAGGSPLVDKIPAASCPATDQRLFVRPQNPLCDVGAVEAAPTAPVIPLNQPNVQPFFLGRILVRPVLWPILSDPNVEAQRLEVTQAIQAAAGTGVVMVANKATFVRFHVRNTSFSADPVVGARLWRIVNGQRVGDPIMPSSRLGVIRYVPYLRLGGGISTSWTYDPYITVRRTPDRNALNDSFYFRLPSAWTAAGSLTVEAEVNPTFLSTVMPEADHSDNLARATVNFQSTPSMVVRLFAVRTRINNVVQAPTETQLREFESWLRRAYPIHRLRIIRDVEDMTNLGRLPTCDEVNGRLFWDNLFLKWAGIDEVDTRYYGMVSDGPGGTNFMRGCADDIPSFIASGPTGDPSTHGFSGWDTNNDGVSYGDWYGGHELGHTWGRKHVLCRGDEVGTDGGFEQDSGTIGRKNNADTHWGFDTALKGPVVYPPTWTDIMSYCSNQWISAYTYIRIRDRLVSENAAMLAAQAMEPAGGPPPIDSLVIQGRVKTDSPGAVIDLAYRLTAPDVVPSVPGPWSIRLVGAGGAVLASYPFTPRTDTDDPDGIVTLPRFAEQVPWVAGTQLIQIVHETDGLLTQRAVSPNAPSATVTAPAAGITINSSGLTVSWTASDPDGGALTSTVLFSRDGGATFTPLRLHLATAAAPAVNTVVIPLGELAQTTQGIVRVTVSDGVNTGQDDSDPSFNVPNLWPAVVILAPANGTSYPYGVTVDLLASAVDPETLELPDGAYAWSSSIDGPLGTGPDLQAELLSPGTHTIRVLVSDSQGGQGAAERTVVISADAMVAAAALSVSPASTTFFAAFGSSGVQTQVMSVRNNTGGEVTWSATSSAPWLTLNVANGQSPSEVLLTVNPAGVPVGLHKAVLTVSGAGAAGAVPQQKIQVFLHVDGEQVWLPLVRNR